MFALEGTTLGHYQLQHRIARGGMSEIYLAYDKQLQRSVAIKVMQRGNDNYVERFQREIKALSTLKHEHILPIFASGEEASWCYFVMPYIEHGTLRGRITQGPLELEEAGIILTQVASALQWTHEHGILHRDIKPSNILLHNERHVYLADFGLAKEVEGADDLTQTGELLGTPEYIAPELTEGPGSASSDIYALGIVLYQMLTGRVPFKAKTPIAVCWKHILEQPLRPSLLNPTITHPIEQVILCALEKEPAQRFRTAQDMALAYNAALKASAYPQTLQLTLPSIRYKTDPLSTLPVFGNIHRKVHPAMAVLLATILFSISLSLGFLAYKDGLSSQAPSALSANIAFAKSRSATQVEPPRLQPAPTPSPTSSPVSAKNRGQSHRVQSHKGNGNGGSGGYGSNGGGGNHGRGHKHGHGRRHGR